MTAMAAMTSAIKLRRTQRIRAALLGERAIPSAEEILIRGPGHFLQEEAGPEYAQLIIDFINGNPKGFTIDQKVISKEDIL